MLWYVPQEMGVSEARAHGEVIRVSSSAWPGPGSQCCSISIFKLWVSCRAFLSWLWLPNVLLFSIRLSFFYIVVPYRSQSSSSNTSLKLLLAIFMLVFENLSIWLCLSLVSWPECVRILGYSGYHLQFSSATHLCLTLCNPMDCSTPSFSVPHQLWSLLKLMSFELVIPSNHLILWCPLLLMPSIFPNNRNFSNECVLYISWPKYWSFSFSINPSNEYSGLISFRMDWFDLFAVQGTLKSLLQHHSSKVSNLQH